MPSNKNFAYSFSLIFFIISLFFLYLEKANLIYLFLTLSSLFLLGGKLKPELFKYLNYIWNKFALILHFIISPIVILIIFFFIITPFGIIGRLFSNDLKNIRGYKQNKMSSFLNYENKTNYDNQF
tara:strand:+ start:80 stop:454 length:375 start_codon:yes stop_codon:yes gene_type:complete